MRMKGRSSIIIACFLAVGQATKSMADYSTTINAPTLKSGASYAIGATIQYGGTVSWLTGNVAAMYVGVDWAYGSAATYTDSVSNNSLGIGDSESANIASTKAYSLTFQSDGYTDYNKIYHQPVPLRGYPATLFFSSNGLRLINERRSQRLRSCLKGACSKPTNKFVATSAYMTTNSLPDSLLLRQT